jgi:hypothetical protein
MRNKLQTMLTGPMVIALATVASATQDVQSDKNVALEVGDRAPSLEAPDEEVAGRSIHMFGDVRRGMPEQSGCPAKPGAEGAECPASASGSLAHVCRLWQAGKELPDRSLTGRLGCGLWMPS